jgi:glucose/mannose transport system substrate-binding protein
VSTTKFITDAVNSTPDEHLFTGGGSKDGQAAFNPKKGSIPARTDVPASLFDSIAQRFMGEFKNAQLTPSIAHGSAAPEAFASGLNDEMGQFVQKKNVNASASNIAKLADQFLK